MAMSGDLDEIGSALAGRDHMFACGEINASRRPMALAYSRDARARAKKRRARRA
jgi:hypothetical protein